MSLIEPAARSLDDGNGLSRADYLAQLERASVLVTLNNLVSFPWIKSRVEQQQLKLLGSYFDVATGAIEVYDPDRGVFAPLSMEATAA
jgi:carbonic anhydrase